MCSRVDRTESLNTLEILWKGDLGSMRVKQVRRVGPAHKQAGELA